MLAVSFISTVKVLAVTQIIPEQTQVNGWCPAETVLRQKARQPAKKIIPTSRWGRAA